MPIAPNLLKTGFITGKQAQMTPKRASRHVRRESFSYCGSLSCALMLVAVLILAIVMAQILYGKSIRIHSFRLSLRAHLTPIENIPATKSFFLARAWRPHKTGIGSVTVVTSIKRLNTAMNRLKEI